MKLKAVDPMSQDLISLQRNGRLYWRDSALLPGWMASAGLTRKAVQLSPQRTDFTEEQLYRWATSLELFERVEQ